MPSQCLLGELCKVFAVWSHQTLCTKLRHFLVLFCKDEIACTISKGNCLHQLPSTKSRTFWSELFEGTKWLMGQRTRCRAIKCLLTFLDAPSRRLAFYLVERCFFYVLFFLSDLIIVCMTGITPKFCKTCALSTSPLICHCPYGPLMQPQQIDDFSPWGFFEASFSFLLASMGDIKVFCWFFFFLVGFKNLHDTVFPIQLLCTKQNRCLFVFVFSPSQTLWMWIDLEWQSSTLY